MKKLVLAVLLIAVLLTTITLVQTLKDIFIIIPTKGNITTVNVSVTWLVNGTEVVTQDWETTDNSTEYEMDPYNITNTSNVPVTLQLSTANHSASIITLILTWNYTGAPLQPFEWQVVALTQNCTATRPYTYDTIIRGIET